MWEQKERENRIVLYYPVVKNQPVVVESIKVFSFSFILVLNFLFDREIKKKKSRTVAAILI